MLKEEKQKLFLYLWGMIGILSAIMISFMEAGGGWNVDNFLNQDQTCEYTQDNLLYTEETCTKNPETGNYTVIAEKTVLEITDIQQSTNWKYMFLQLSNLNVEKTYWNIVFTDKKGRAVSKQTATLVEGDNVVEVACRQPFQGIKLVIKEQPGLVFQINKLQFRMNDAVITPQSVMTNFFFWLGLYVGISAIVCLIRKTNLYTGVEILQEGYCLFGNFVGKHFIPGIGRKHIGVVRTLILSLILILGEMSGICVSYMDASRYKYYMLAIAILVILLGVLCWEKDLELLNWKSVIPMAWIFLWIYICFSDVMESKTYKFVGYIFLLTIGFFFFAWNNMEEPQKVKQEMYRAFDINFVTIILYCMFFRTKKIGVLYNGAFADRESFAIYATTAVAVFLIQLYREVFHQDGGWKSTVKTVLYIAGIAISVSLLYYTDTVCCNIAFVVEMTIFFAYIIKKREHLTKTVKAMSLTMLPAVLAAVISVQGINFAINELPQRLGTEIVYENEVLQTKQDTTVLESLRMIEPEYYDKVYCAGDENKVQVWKDYLRKINLFGHEDELERNQSKTKAYNGWIEMIYRYGIFILIPYMLLWGACLKHAWKEKEEMLFLIATFMVIMLLQNIEFPFAQPLWILCYFGMGEWFFNQ